MWTDARSKAGALAVWVCVALLPWPAGAATLTVTKTADTDDGVCDVDCSLREAIDAAVSGDTVAFSPLFNAAQTIVLGPGGLRIDKGLTLAGPGAHLLTIVGTSIASSVFTISPNVDQDPVTLRGLTISGGGWAGVDNWAVLAIEDCVLSANDGSGLYNLGIASIDASTITGNTGGYNGRAGGVTNRGTLTMTNSTISDNVADDASPGAGGIFNGGFLTLVNATISGNRKLGGDENGGGIYSDGSTTILNSTITDNEADGAGSAGGVMKEYWSGVVTVGSSIIAANGVIPDVVESSFGFASDGFNLIGNVGTATGFTFLGDRVGTGPAPLDPGLDPLGHYGGPTKTHRLRVTSVAVDKGASSSLAADQRGFRRPFDRSTVTNATGGDGTDIGAYELQFTLAVAGRVTAPTDVFVRNVPIVAMSGGRPIAVTKTDRFGAFRFDDVPRNMDIVLSVQHPQHAFAPRTVHVRDGDVIGIDLVSRR